MDIFIAGNLSSIAPALVNRFLDGGHAVVITDPPDGFGQMKSKRFTTYQISTSDTLYEEIFRSHTFDVVLFIAAREDGMLEKRDPVNEKINTGLGQALALSGQTGVNQFIYISSIKVYGDSEIAKEDALPVPLSSEGQSLLNGENLCRFYGNNHDLPVSIIRVPYIYSPGLINSFLNTLIQKAKSDQVAKIHVHPLSHCSFLHFDDLFTFLENILEDETRRDLHVFNLSAENINFTFLTEQIKYYLPGAGFAFDDRADGASAVKKIEVSAAVELYNWHPTHKLIADLPSLLKTGEKEMTPKKSFGEWFHEISQKYKPLLVWGEVLLGAFLMHMLTVWTSTIIEFKYIDYRLLYVVLIGSTHGLLFGVLASLLAAASGALTWSRIGLDWALLIYNVENWIPFALFFLAGAVTGYVHDKKENEIDFERQQTALIHEKYEFLYSLYDEISSIKDRLRDQLVGYRDSFGRFFRIANELNDLEEDNIFFKALENLEELMRNDQIAIYSVEHTGSYGRLEVKSKNITRKIPKSINISDFSAAIEILKRGDIFQNKDLLPNYPSYIAPISNNGNLIGMVIIWEARFEQFSMYYKNLFKVITGMIQSSLVRAATFKNAQKDKLYIPSTQIMRPGPFKQSLAIRKKMRRNRIADFQIVRIDKGEDDWVTIQDRLERGIRGDDIAGMLDENDPFCYVLLANADVENIGIILDRLDALDLHSEFVEELESE